jgi:Fur family iron response transcriptional regulator
VLGYFTKGSSEGVILTDKNITVQKTRPFSQVLNRLRTSGLRPTRQRLALAKLLYDQDMCRHVTAEVLHDEAHAAGARISLATVYNTLHQFTTAGLLREIVVDSGRTYFDTNVTDHHHFFYENDGRLEDIGHEGVMLSCLPDAPKGTKVARVDVIIRVVDCN